MRRIGLIVLTGAVLLVAAPLRAAPLFCDAFKTKTDPAWGNQDGAWTIAKHKYWATAPNNAPLTYTDLVAYQSLTNFTVTVTVNDVYDGGVWLRSTWNGAANGILLVVGGGYSNYTGLYWHVVTNGQVGPPQNLVTLPNFEGSTAKLKIVAKGQVYSVYVNGAKTAATTLTDSTYSSGSVGLYDYSVAPQETFSKFCLAAAK